MKHEQINFSDQEVELLQNYSFEELVEFADCLNDYILSQQNFAGWWEGVKSAGKTIKDFTRNNAVTRTLTGEAQRSTETAYRIAKAKGDLIEAKRLKSLGRSQGLRKWGSRVGTLYLGKKISDTVMD